MTSSNRGRLIVDIAGPRLDGTDIEFLTSPEIGGVILFARNFENRRQIAELVGEIRAIKNDLLICVDQEGGRVQRFREGFSRLPSLKRLRQLCDAEPQSSVEIVESLAWLMAVEVLNVGVDLSFAPVLDLDDDKSKVIGDRSFSPDPQQAILLATHYLRGMQEAGMASTGKHFPGHGAVVGDSHHELPVDSRSFDEIRESDLRPFAELAPILDAVMPAHLVYPAVDSNPAGFSEIWIQQVLRQQLKFTGVVFSDDLSMLGAAGVGDGIARAEAALTAGCDLLLVCNDRLMAEDIRAWMAGQPIVFSNAAERMRARKNWTDAEIVEHKNYQLAQKYIKKIEETSARV